MPSGAGDGRVEQVAVEHSGKAIAHRKEDCIIFAALCFVDGDRIGQRHILQALIVVPDRYTAIREDHAVDRPLLGTTDDSENPHTGAPCHFL